MKEQIEMVSLEQLVREDHIYRKFNRGFDFKEVEKHLECLKKDNNFEGYGAMRLLKCLLLQHLENLSDRELEKYLQDTTSAKWFCGFGLLDRTPDYSSFSKFRSRLGIDNVIKIFETLKKQLQKGGLMCEAFTVIDASNLISKAQLWEERDKAIADGQARLDNQNITDYAHDKEARIGCKGKDKYWFGYKISKSIDTAYGFINKVSVCPANIHDSKAMEAVLPNGGVIYADKGYAGEEPRKVALKHNCILKAIKKNNNKQKNHKEDAYISKCRMPFERMFARMNKKARYIGIIKNQMSELFNAIAFNMRRLATLTTA